MTDCIISPLKKDKDGYPRMKHGGRNQPASRILWRILHGEIPEGMLVCHHCDNPSCVNPDHLYLGSFEDNMRDKDERDRNPSGRFSGNWKENVDTKLILAVSPM